jgi:hypothetical protein
MMFQGLKQFFLVLTVATGAAAQGNPAGAWGGPLDSCIEQASCVNFSVDKVESAASCGGGCEFKVCLDFKLGGSCPKSSTISHSCMKKPNECSLPGFGSAGEVGNVGSHTQCQTVPPNSVAQFLLKDGSGCYGTATSGGASCFPRPSGIESCTGNGVGKECIWTLPIPSCDPGAQGDPHFKTWTGDKYDFHGACDLVLLTNPGFNDGLGMDIHIRTTRVEEVYSYISGAVINIGEDTLEVQGDKENVQYFINGVLGTSSLSHDTTLDQTLSGFPIKYRQVDDENRDFIVYLQDANGYYGTVAITTWNGYVGVDIYDANERSFETSVGLLGSFTHGERVGRDGKLISDVNEFGLEWQVRDTEDKLFHNAVGPQYPQKCIIPSVAETEERNKNYTVSLEDAELACAGVPAVKRDQCIFDVRQTSDLHMARVYV